MNENSTAKNAIRLPLSTRLEMEVGLTKKPKAETGASLPEKVIYSRQLQGNEERQGLDHIKRQLARRHVTRHLVAVK